MESEEPLAVVEVAGAAAEEPWRSPDPEETVVLERGAVGLAVAKPWRRPQRGRPGLAEVPEDWQTMEGRVDQHLAVRFLSGRAAVCGS